MPPTLPVVIHTGPLIALAPALGDLEVLAHVAMLVVVPGEVFTECAAGAHHDDTADKVRAAPCCHIRPVFSALPPALLDLLDIGEAAVIHTALTEGIVTVAIDEIKGRRVAHGGASFLHRVDEFGAVVLRVAVEAAGRDAVPDDVEERAAGDAPRARGRTSPCSGRCRPPAARPASNMTTPCDRLFMAVARRRSLSRRRRSAYEPASPGRAPARPRWSRLTPGRRRE